MKLVSLVTLCLSAKYEERVSFKVSGIAKSMGFMNQNNLTKDSIRK